MVRVFNYGKSTGELTGSAHLTGTIGTLASMGGARRNED